MMHSNSLSAHAQNIEFNSYSNMSERIVASFQELKQGRMHDVANYLGVELNKISGRFGSLVKQGKLEISETQKIGRYNYSIYKLKN